MKGVAPLISSAALLCLAVLAGAAFGANIPPVKPRDQVLILTMAGHHLTAPLPDWTDLSSLTPPTEQSQAISQKSGRKGESVLFFSKDETPLFWTHLVGVLVVNQPGYSADMQIASMVEPFRKACDTGQLRVARIPPVKAGVLSALLLVCGRYRPTASVPSNCGGGIILGVAMESPEGAAKIYNEWCTSRFDATDTSTWPVTEAHLAALTGQLQTRSSFTPLVLSAHGRR